MKNRVNRIIPPGLQQGDPMGLHLGMPETMLGALEMASVGIVGANTTTGAAIGTNLTGLIAALSLDPAGTAPAGIVLMAYLIEGITELRALGEEQLQVLKQIEHMQEQAHG